MKNEIIRLIRQSFNGIREQKPREDFASAALALAREYGRAGDEPFKKRIEGVVKEFVSLGDLGVDGESGLPFLQSRESNGFPLGEVADLSRFATSSLILSGDAERTVSQFIEEYRLRDEIAAAGIPPSSRILLYGMPGCGKTTTAALIAKRMGKGLVIARTESIVSSLLGNTEKNISALFERCSRGDCVLFLDEIDSLSQSRESDGPKGGSAEREMERSTTVLLQQFDKAPESLVVIGATNIPSEVDRALWRRFDFAVELPPPTEGQAWDLIASVCSNFDPAFSAIAKAAKEGGIENGLWGKVNGLSFSDIKTIAQNAVKASIVRGEKTASIKAVEDSADMFLRNRPADIGGIKK